MQIAEKAVSDIKPYEKNPRKNDGAVDAVAESIKQFGFKVPIVIDRDNVIVAGHTRYKAAKRLRLATVPCITADDLTPEQIKAYRLADNKVGELAEWDFDLLGDELSEIFDIDMNVFGFEDEDEEEPEIEAEMPFAETLDETHNYLVLYFDNDVDWLQAQSLFETKPVKEYSSRKDGAIKKPQRGVGRVLNGAKALSSLVEVHFDADKH